jgi:site-specific DNA-methyltransferase (adenine-specific)
MRSLVFIMDYNSNTQMLSSVITEQRLGKLKLNTVYNEDALEGLKKIPSDTCQIIIADPPYFRAIKEEWDNQWNSLEDYLNWSDKWIRECIRILKPKGTMYIYGFSETLAYIFVRIPINKKWLVWHYTNKNVPSLNFWQRSHESIICMWKDEHPDFNRDEVRVPYTKTYLEHSAGRIRTPTVGRFGGGKITRYKAHENGALPRDVITVPALAGGAGRVERVKHPTQKPLQLCDILIKAAKNQNNIVLVPFVGSGSECVSAIRNDCNFIGFELNKDYVSIAEDRIKKAMKDAKVERENQQPLL